MPTCYFDKKHKYKYSQLFMEQLQHWTVQKKRLVDFSNSPRLSRISYKIKGAECITNKSNLARNSKDYIPTTLIVNRSNVNNTVFPEEKCFIKIPGRENGTGTYYIEGQIKQAAIKALKRHQTIVVQKEVPSLLLGNHKFTCRMYVILVITQKQLGIYMLKYGLIKKANYQEQMTNTSITKTPSAIIDHQYHYYPRMKEIVTDIIVSNIANFEKNQQAFQILGPDFIISENGTVYLLEVNAFPGLFDNKQDSLFFHQGIEQKIFEEIEHLTLAAILDGKLNTSTCNYDLCGVYDLQ